MYYNWNKQVLRREQIKERTLVLGMNGCSSRFEGYRTGEVLEM
jgi:hypothetical protein